MVTLLNKWDYLVYYSKFKINFQKKRNLFVNFLESCCSSFLAWPKKISSQTTKCNRKIFIYSLNCHLKGSQIGWSINVISVAGWFIYSFLSSFYYYSIVQKSVLAKIIFFSQKNIDRQSRSKWREKKTKRLLWFAFFVLCSIRILMAEQ